MTTISTHDTASAPALADIPPMSLATMAVGLTDLLDEAADLPQPRYIDMHHAMRPAYDLASRLLYFAAVRAMRKAGPALGTGR
jgi:hypothetical protein